MSRVSRIGVSRDVSIPLFLAINLTIPFVTLSYGLIRPLHHLWTKRVAAFIPSIPPGPPKPRHRDESILVSALENAQRFRIRAQ